MKLQIQYQENLRYFGLETDTEQIGNSLRWNRKRRSLETAFLSIYKMLK